MALDGIADMLKKNFSQHKEYPSRGKFKLLIKPAKKNIHSFLEEIRKVFRKARSTTQADLIKILNPKLRGWANYHRSAVSKETFSKIDAVIWQLSFRWAMRRHPGKSKGWVRRVKKSFFG
jgi:RNA-directed DNA polymerase